MNIHLIRCEEYPNRDFADLYVDGPAQYAIAYELAAITLQSQMFDRYDQLAAYAHKDSRGCINDLCQNKPDIRMKLRTADLCDECISILHQRKIDPLLVTQIYAILDRVRQPLLFRERYKITQRVSRLEVRGYNLRLFLTDLEDEELRLSPMQRALYLLYLRHPEGIAFSYLPDYQDELENIYSRTFTGGSIATMKKAVETLVTNEDGKLNQVVSKIRDKIVQQLGKELAQSYIIQGHRGEKKSIPIDRQRIYWRRYD